MRPIIKVENLSKKYRIGGSRVLYGSLRDVISVAVRSPLSWFRRNGNPEENTIWALKDVSFEITPGHVVGIIGRNGAGKSTLLKIFSRITEPTTGQVDIYGQVGSLLEVGTGFHLELSGRENIYLNGAILGMKRREIERKFDEIVDFAEVSKFIDTPVKHYSSGMHMRLAFAVAAHLEPEILIVDEVLAVGDITFQKKCLGKMGEISKEGRTVLFVSHNMNVINSLCSHAILLNGGRIAAIGDKATVVNKYIELISELAKSKLEARTDRVGDGKIHFEDYFFEDWDGKRLDVLRSGQNVVIAAKYVSDSARDLKNISVAFALQDNQGNQFTDLANRYTGEVWDSIPPTGIFRCYIPRLPLMPGYYTFGVFADVNGVIADWVTHAGRFAVEVGDFYRTGKVLDQSQGNILFDHHWAIASDTPILLDEDIAVKYS